MKNKTIKLSYLTISILTSLTVLPTVAEESTAKNNEIETITVTSQKRTERLIEVPISVTNVDKKELERRGIKQLKDIGDAAPNISVSQTNDFNSKVVIRGVGSNSRNIGFDSRVGVYIDGVYLGQSPAINQGLVDLQRVEVLRGPQGTLFGKNTIAGAVNLISQQPSEDFEGAVKINIGNFDSRDVNLKLNVPVTDNTGATIFINKVEQEGYATNKLLGTKAGGKDGTAMRINLVSDVSDNFKVSLAADHASQDNIAFNNEALTGVFGGHPITGPLGDIHQGAASEKYVYAQNRDLEEEKTVWGSSLTLDYDFENDFSLKSITAYRYTDIDVIIDSDRSPLALIETPYNDTYKQLTQEIQLISPDDKDFKYVLGLYLFDLESTTDRIAHAGMHGPILGLQADTDVVVVDGAVDTTSYAVYGNSSYQLNSDWVLGLGLRYSSETKKVNWSIDGTRSGIFNMATANVVDENTYTNLSPSLSLNYAINNNSQAYTRLSTGFKSGGYNLDFITQAVLDGGIDFEAETVNNIELGYKAELLGNRLRLNTALFYAAYDDYQVNQYVDLGDGRTSLSIENAAEVVTQGLEAELDYQITDDFEMTTSIGLLDAEFDSFPGGGTAGADASGNKLPNAPEVTAALSFQYYQDLPSVSSNLMYRVDYNYTGDQYFLINNDEDYTVPGDSGYTVPFDHVDDYSTINARITLYTDDDKWEASVWGRNLTDSDHVVDSFKEFFGTVLAGYAQPRTYGVEIKYNF